MSLGTSCDTDDMNLFYKCTNIVVRDGNKAKFSMGMNVQQLMEFSSLFELLSEVHLNDDVPDAIT